MPNTMTPEEQWKEELRKEIWVYEDKYKDTTVGHYAKLDEHMEQFIFSLLSSQREALTRKVMKCVPEKDIPKIGSENHDVYVTYANGFNDCREQTLQGLGEI